MPEITGTMRRIGTLFSALNTASSLFIYVIGNDTDVSLFDKTEGESVYQADFPESRQNLKFKLFSAFKWVDETYDYQYIIKTDIDVAMNYTLWINAIVSRPEQPVLYSGFSCHGHADADHPWCSGMGYALHHSVIPTIVSFPESDYDIPEDRTVGKILSQAGLKVSGLWFGKLKDPNFPISFRRMVVYNCVIAEVGFRDVLAQVPALHFVGNTKHIQLKTGFKTIQARLPWARPHTNSGCAQTDQTTPTTIGITFQQQKLLKKRKGIAFQTT
eukprot:sb/3468143/